MARTKVFVDIVTKDDKAKKAMLGYAAATAVAVAAVAGLMKVGKELIDIYSVQEQAESRLKTTIEATGQAAGLTFDQLNDMATGLQSVTTYGDEAIIGAQALLLTFKDIGEDTFPRATEAILDMSTAMGTDLKSTSIQVGKALNDPIKGISALTRVGVQFTDTQKGLIKALQDGGDMAGAQDIILKELESQFGGLAKAAGELATGSFKQLDNVTGDLKEAYGGLIADALEPLNRLLITMVTSWADVIDKQRQAIAFTRDFKDGTIDEIRTLGELEDILEGLEKQKGQAGRGAYIEDEIVAVKALILAYGIQDTFLIKAAESALALARAKTDAEYSVAAAAAATTELEKAAAAELAQIQSDRLSDDEKELAALRTKINFWATYRDSIEGAEEIFQAYAEERNELQEAMLEKDEELLLLSTEALLEDIKTRRDAKDDALREELALFQEAADEEIRINDEKDAAIKEGEEKALEDFKEMMQKKIDAINLYGSAALDILRAIDAYQDATASAELQRMIDAGASEEELDKKRKEIAIANAKREKAIALMSVALDTASAIIGMLANPGGPPGIVLSAMAGVTGAIQAAAIQATPLPAFALGGDFTTSGPQTIMVGDNPGGREHVSIAPASSPNINGPSGYHQPIQIFLGNELIYDSISQGTKDHLIDIHRGAIV